VLTMQRSAEGLLEILVAREALELAPWPTPRMAVGANVAAPHSTIVGTRFLRAIMQLRIHIARAATPGHDQLR
jgi:hypothetical protein